MKKSVYGLTGEEGLVAEIIKLTKEGIEVCPHGTHSAGLGSYVIDYEDVEHKIESEEVESEPNIVEEPEDEEIKDEIKNIPDMDFAKSLLSESESEAEAKSSLIEYATSFDGVEESDFDKRKGFEKLLEVFKSKV